MISRCLHTVVKSLLFACFLLAPTLGHSQVKYKRVTSEDDLQIWQVYVLANPDAGLVATCSDWRKKSDVATTAINITTVEASEVDDCLLPSESENLLELILDYDNNLNGFPWRFSVNDRQNEGGVLSFNNITSKLYEGVSIAGSNYSKSQSKNQFAASISGLDDIAFYCDPQKPICFVPSDNGGYTLNCVDPDTEGALPAYLYKKDVYDLYIIDPKPVYTKGDVIKVHTNIYPDDNEFSKGFFYSVFSTGNDLLSVDDIYDLTKKYTRQSSYPDGIIEMEYPGGDVTLWVGRDHAGNNDRSDILRVKIAESKGITSTDEGHFVHPAAQKYNVGEEVKFERNDDVKIFYTLDGQDPVIANVERAISRAGDDETEEEEGDDPAADDAPDDLNSEHADKTYDLDLRPIKYDGSPLNIKYLALKSGYDPSEVKTLTIEGTTSLLTLPANNTEEGVPAYFDLMGRKIPQPTAPGIYLRSTPNKTEKILLR